MENCIFCAVVLQHAEHVLVVCSLFALAHGQKIDDASDKKNYGTLLNS